MQLNIASMTELTYRLLPAMLEAWTRRDRQVSSVAGFQHVAYMPVYSASKAFVCCTSARRCGPSAVIVA